MGRWGVHIKVKIMIVQINGFGTCGSVGKVNP
jgi:hypothetical protein